MMKRLILSCKDENRIKTTKLLLLRSLSSTISKIYDSQSGKYISTSVKKRIYDLTLLYINNYDIKKMKKNNIIVLPSLSRIDNDLIKEKYHFSIIVNNNNDINDIIKQNKQKNQLEVCINININDNIDMIKIKDLINISNKNNLITTSIINITDIDLYKIDNIIANLADYNSQYILLSLKNLFDEDIINEMIDMANNIDCEGNPISTRLGLFFDNSYSTIINTKICHFGINRANTNLFNEFEKMKLI